MLAKSMPDHIRSCRVLT